MTETEKQRANWGSHVEFILTLVGFAVGLGNVWRFPYLCFENGGGAFLIPYFICLVVMGIPLFYLELSFGQFASLGPVKIWIINPAMKGLGYSMIIVSALISLYYNVIIAVCIYYFFASMRSTLLWTSCDPDWASCLCRDNTMNKSDPDPWNSTRQDCLNYTFNESKVTNPSEEYFSNRVLRQTSGLDVTGGISWELTLCLLLAWTIVFLVLTKGIKSLGKVVYVTAIFPYILLTALLIRGLTLDGSKDGIDFYLTPNITKLGEAKVWSDAAVQIFYSLSACSGGLIAMASYNNFRNNVLRDTFLVPVINCLTSFYAGFVIFASLGFMANQKGVSVKDVAAGGPGLAFVAYPEALAQMPASPVWAVLFFLMMMMLGFSSEFSIVETVLTGVLDDFPSIRRSKYKAILFRASYCIVGFVLGLPMCTGCGFHLLDLVDNATGGFPLLFVGFFEVIAIAYIYGFVRFRKDILMMLGDTPLLRSISKFSFVYFGPMWMVFTPLCLLAVIVFKCIQYKTKHEEDPGVFPQWADVIWWLIVLTPVLCIPFWFLAYFFRNGAWRVLCDVNSPKPTWGPALKENRAGVYGDLEMTPSGFDKFKMNDSNSDLGYDSSKGLEETNGKFGNGLTQFDNEGYTTEKF
ncbi:sodium- and chloride-dependent glycine transporter 1-like isoform X2 [Ruditapes philippinarum]|uniref:sodium- and chloride-dependent glycine transporter 1-like isoform X2 n=1 Tax=Ruditapes philippinarum TaxID=129788 RepID=UPI00295A8B7E|nr:sodium- and chloride-dependent glycine transporter 1-like isoform X2 [Ruditapes philippinarum]